MAGLFKRFKSTKDEKEDKQKEKKIEKDVVKKPKAAPKAQEKKSEKEKVERKKLKKKDAEAYKYLLKPLITEKATDLSAQNQYAFVVPRNANKIEIAKKVEHVYGVTPVKVRIINCSGKRVRYGRRIGRTKAWKKAIVILKPEDKLEIYEGV